MTKNPIKSFLEPSNFNQNSKMVVPSVLQAKKISLLNIKRTKLNSYSCSNEKENFANQLNCDKIVKNCQFDILCP